MQDTVTTLIVKHLPDFITTSAELRESYFKPYKPIDVRFMQSQAMVNTHSTQKHDIQRERRKTCVKMVINRLALFF